MDIKQIVNQINYLDEQVKAMLLIEDRATRMQYLENMKLSVDILKAWAGKPSNERGALPIPDVSGQSELLSDFLIWYKSALNEFDECKASYVVSEYLKSLNSR